MVLTQRSLITRSLQSSSVGPWYSDPGIHLQTSIFRRSELQIAKASCSDLDIRTLIFTFTFTPSTVRASFSNLGPQTLISEPSLNYFLISTTVVIQCPRKSISDPLSYLLTSNELYCYENVIIARLPRPPLMTILNNRGRLRQLSLLQVSALPLFFALAFRITFFYPVTIARTRHFSRTTHSQHCFNRI